MNIIEGYPETRYQVFTATGMQTYYESQIDIQKSDEEMQAFKELVATRYEAKKYLPDDFDPDAELEAARKERYDSID